MANTVTETQPNGVTIERTARDDAHAQRMTERIKSARPSSKVTTK